MKDDSKNEEVKVAYIFYGVTEWAYGKNFKILLDRRSYSEPDLVKSREEAYDRYDTRKPEIDRIQDMLIPQNPESETIYLKTVIDLCIIQYIDENNFKEFYLEGREKEELEKGRLMEKKIFELDGIPHPGTYSSIK